MKKSYLIVFILWVLQQLPAQNPAFVWASKISRTSNMSTLDNSMVADQLGNVYRTGRFSDTADFDPGPGTASLVSAHNFDAYILKLNAGGGLVWAKRIGGPDFQHGTAIAVDKAGNVYVTGDFSDTVDFDPGPYTYTMVAAGASDVFILKLNSAGNFIWAKRIGGCSYDQASAITIDASANLYLTGQVYGCADLDFDPGPGSYSLNVLVNPSPYVCKLDSACHLLWAKLFTGSNANGGACSIGRDALNNVYTLGQFSGTMDFDPGNASFTLAASSGSLANSDVYISKLDAAGNFVWAKQIGDSIGAYGICVTPNGEAYFTGSFQGTTDFDPGPGLFSLTTHHNSRSAYVGKLDASGNFLWAKAFYSNLNHGATGSALAADSLNNIYTTGFSNGVTDFDPGAGVMSYTAAPHNQAFISKLSSLGNFVWAKQVGQGFNAYATAIAQHANSIYITGCFADTVDFDPGPGVTQLVAQNTGDMFFVRFDEQVLDTRLSENRLEKRLACEVFPNPSAGDLIIDCGDLADEGRVRMYDLLGALVYENSQVMFLKQVNLLLELKGVYFLEIESGGERVVKKVVFK